MVDRPSLGNCSFLYCKHDDLAHCSKLKIKRRTPSKNMLKNYSLDKYRGRKIVLNRACDRPQTNQQTYLLIMCEMGNRPKNRMRVCFNYSGSTRCTDLLVMNLVLVLKQKSLHDRLLRD